MLSSSRPAATAFPVFAAGRLLHIAFEACSAFTHVTACRLAESPKATLFSEYFNDFVTSAVAPIATGWNDQLPGGIRTR
jgi:hypothetical protein